MILRVLLPNMKTLRKELIEGNNQPIDVERAKNTFFNHPPTSVNFSRNICRKEKKLEVEGGPFIKRYN